MVLVGIQLEKRIDTSFAKDFCSPRAQSINSTALSMTEVFGPPTSHDGISNLHVRQPEEIPCLGSFLHKQW